MEADAVMLGQPVSMVLPQVVGYRLTGQLGQLATSTDLVLTITEVLIISFHCVCFFRKFPKCIFTFKYFYFYSIVTVLLSFISM